MYEIPNVIDSYTCLLPMVTDFSRTMLNLYSHYEKGVLPFTGGLLNQPHAFYESMIIINNYLAETNKHD